METLLDKLYKEEEESKKYINPLNIDEEKPFYEKLEIDYSNRWNGKTFMKKIKKLDNTDIEDLGWIFHKKELIDLLIYNFFKNEFGCVTYCLYLEGSPMFRDYPLITLTKEYEVSDQNRIDILFKGRLRHKLDLKRIMIQTDLLPENEIQVFYELNLNE